MVMIRTCLICIILLIAAPASFGDRKIVNNSGKPVAVRAIVDSKGTPFAELYMTGKEMIFDDYGEISLGAGYYLALENNYYYIPFSKGGFGGLHVDRIEWDDAGKTTSIKGLRPFFESAEEIKITSDVNNPKLADGVLFLKLDGHGDLEFKFSMAFGKGTNIDPPVLKIARDSNKEKTGSKPTDPNKAK
jgi:hypothetical protein